MVIGIDYGFIESLRPEPELEDIDELTPALNNLFRAGRLYWSEEIGSTHWSEEIGKAADVIDRLISESYENGRMDEYSFNHKGKQDE